VPVKSVCRLCKADCGILATVEQNRLVGVEGNPDCPLNRGALCSKGQAMVQLVYDPDRVTRPLRRDGNGFRPVAWGETLDEIAAALQLIKAKYGATALATYEGASFSRANTQAYIRRFLHYFGSPNRTGTESLCVAPKYVAARATFGPGLIPTADFASAGVILLFGANPAVTGMHRYLRAMDDILAARRRGAKLVVVDPILTDTAAKADLWVPVRPGSDLVLLLGLIRIIIEEGLYDREFVSRYTVGFEDLAHSVGEYTPERVERLTGVPQALTVEVARLFAGAGRAVIDRREGLMHSTRATQTNRALLLLAAICGQVDREGALTFTPALPLNQGVLAQDRLPSGTSFFARNRFPFGDEAGLLPETILSARPYPIKALIVTAGNPVMAWPNTEKVIRALKELELLVVIDLYQTETAAYADYVLPGVTCLERNDLSMNNLMPFPLVRLAGRVLPPRAEAWTEWRIFNELGRRLYGPEYAYASEEAFLDDLLAGSGISLADLQEHPDGIIHREKKPGRFLTDGFPTPSGKIELYSGMLKEAGFDPLPRYREKAPADENYPYKLITGSRLSFYSHSTLMNLPWLYDLYPRHYAEVAPDVAAAAGVRDEDLVEIITPHGSVSLPVKVMEASFPGVVLIRHGFGHTGGGRLAVEKGGVNVNYLTGDLENDPLAGTPAYREGSCRLERKL